LSEQSVSLEKAAPRFLFSTVIAVYFFSGGVFVVFSAPLLVSIAKGLTFAGPSEVVLLGIVEFWKPILQTASAAVVVASVLFLSLVLGLVIEPIDRTFSKVLLFVSRAIDHDTGAHRYGPSPLKFKSAMNHYEYAEYLGWLVNQKGPCLHWEWELFLYHLRWSLCTNALLFIASYTRLIWSQSSIPEILLYSIFPTVAFSVYGIFRSRGLWAVNQVYWAKACANGAVTAAREPQPTSGAA
jgi:hypothetical protein